MNMLGFARGIRHACPLSTVGARMGMLHYDLKAVIVLLFPLKVAKTDDDCSLVTSQQSLTVSDKNSIYKCVVPLIVRVGLHICERCFVGIGQSLLASSKTPVSILGHLAWKHHHFSGL